MRIAVVVLGMSIFSFVATAQQTIQTGFWRGQLQRQDGNYIPFQFDVKFEKGKLVIYILNAEERLRVDNIQQIKDSIFIDMPVFESQFRVRKKTNTQWEGKWIKNGSQRQQVMPFSAEAKPVHIPNMYQTPVADITGRWAVSFISGDKSRAPAIGEWKQDGTALRGTFRTPTGDYRYLSGAVDGDSLQLSTFDGSNAFLFKAKINNAQQIAGGVFCSGDAGRKAWEAVKNDTATLPDIAAIYVKNGEGKLNFRFRNLNKKWVSINDATFKNKVVIIQLMGSWCPNCMDETAFLSEYYAKNKHRGIEIIALAYEYSADWERSRKSIQKFKDRFAIQYTLLNTGVAVTDSLRTEKTLPQITRIKSFPSTIFLDKKGRIVKLHSGFEGPGTGVHYEALKKEFTDTIDGLLKQ